MSLSLKSIDERIAQLPEWARPPFYGMFLVYGLIAARAIIAVPILLIVLIAAGPEGILKALWILIVAGLAGFAGGIVFSLLRPILRHAGRAGAIVKGWLCVFVYLATILPLLSPDDPHAKGYFDAHDPHEWIIVAVLSLVFGTALSEVFVEEKREKRPRWIQRKQRVTSRAHPRPTDGDEGQS